MLVYQGLAKWKSLMGQDHDEERRANDSSIRLYIWPSGPGFRTPSLHGECLAAFAYVILLSPPSLEARRPRLDWEVVSSWDPSNSPTCQYPMLQCSCGSRIAGFSPIVGHLRTCENLGGQDGNLDSWMNKDQKADCTAWTSFVSSHASEVLDLYLYVTSTNYTSTTRHAYTEFLPTLLNYIVPPAHCKAAESRTQHLDIVAVLETGGSEPTDTTSLSARSSGTDPTTGFPEKFGFGVKKEGLSAAQKRIRLESMLGRWLDPLEELLGHKKFLLSDEKPSSLDALALGYFSLILGAEVPDRWAARIMEDRFPKLVAWVHREAPKTLLQSSG